jgi:hypothetical protein
MTPSQAISERHTIEVPRSVYLAMRVGLTETIRWQGQVYYLRGRIERQEPKRKAKFYLEVEL